MDACDPLPLSQGCYGGEEGKQPGCLPALGTQQALQASNLTGNHRDGHVLRPFLPLTLADTLLLCMRIMGRGQGVPLRNPPPVPCGLPSPSRRHLVTEPSRVLLLGGFCSP